MTKFFWIFAVALIVILAERQLKCNGEGQIVGGPSEEKPANSVVRGMVKTLKPQISAQLSIRQEGLLYKSSSTLKTISYRTQLVNGINYFIKVRARIGRNKVYYHIKVYESFAGNRTLTGIAGPMLKSAALGYF